MKGNRILTIIGILSIAVGTVNISVYFFAMVSGKMLPAGKTLEQFPKGNILCHEAFVALLSLGLAWSMLQIVMGIVGIKYRLSKVRASGCFRLGVALVIFAVISSAFCFWLQGLTLHNTGSFVAGVVLPLIFCYGARLNKSGNDNK